MYHVKSALVYMLQACYTSGIIALGQFFPSIFKSKMHIQTHAYTHTHTRIADILLTVLVVLNNYSILNT